MPIPIKSTPLGIIIPIRAVPGASRSEIVGPIGDRLKIRIAAPPQDGRANLAIRKLLATTLGLKTSDITIITGTSSRDKTILIAASPAATVSHIRATLGLDLP